MKADLWLVDARATVIIHESRPMAGPRATVIIHESRSMQDILTFQVCEHGADVKAVARMQASCCKGFKHMSMFLCLACMSTNSCSIMHTHVGATTDHKFS